MKPQVNRKTALQAISLYVLASLLMAACQGKSHRAGVLVTRDFKPAEKKQEDVVSLTGEANKNSQSFIFLGKGEGAYALRVHLKTYSEEKLKSAQALSDELASVDVVRSLEGLEAEIVVKATEKNGLKEAQTINLKLVESAAPVKSFSGEGSGYQVAIDCQSPTCRLALMEISRKSDGAMVPYSVEIRDVKIASVINQLNRSKEHDQETVENKNKVKKHYLVEMISNPDKLAVITNNVNMITGESRFALALAGEIPNKSDQKFNPGVVSLDLRGQLYQLQSRSQGVRELIQPASQLKLEGFRTQSSVEKLTFELRSNLKTAAPGAEEAPEISSRSNEKIILVVEPDFSKI